MGTTKLALSPAGDAHLTKTNTSGTLDFLVRRGELEANRQHSPEISASCQTIAVDFIDENGNDDQRRSADSQSE
jgi:hypothetical protein